MKLFLFFHVPGCSGMFRHICFGMFRVPGFIDALFSVGSFGLDLFQLKIAERLRQS